jgi:methylenetetrahydrofolate reductase (NADPH)
MSRLEHAILDRRFVVTAELHSVDSGGIDAVGERVAPFADWVDAVNATDNASARAHASSLAVSIALLRLDVEPVMQLVCRDRNRLALEADIVGGALHGVENVCCLGGDDVTAGDEPEAKRVFDLDSLGLISLASSLAGGRYLSGRPLDPPPNLVIGAVETPGEPFDVRIARALEKVDVGARFLQLQFCFRPEVLEEFMAQAALSGLAERAALIPSIGIVGSPSALRFLDDNVPGVEVPEATIERCENAADPAAECFELAVELAEHARRLPGVAGLHLISFRHEPGIAELCSRLGIPTRSEREMSGYRPPVSV